MVKNLSIIFNITAFPNIIIHHTTKIPKIPTKIPIITINPSLLIIPNDIRIIATPGIVFANKIGVSVIPARIKIKAPISLSVIGLLINVNLLLVKPSNLYK